MTMQSLLLFRPNISGTNVGWVQRKAFVMVSSICVPPVHAVVMYHQLHCNFTLGVTQI